MIRVITLSGELRAPRRAGSVADLPQLPFADARRRSPPLQAPAGRVSSDGHATEPRPRPHTRARRHPKREADSRQRQAVNLGTRPAEGAAANTKPNLPIFRPKVSSIPSNPSIPSVPSNNAASVHTDEDSPNLGYPPPEPTPARSHWPLGIPSSRPSAPTPTPHPCPLRGCLLIAQPTVTSHVVGRDDLSTKGSVIYLAGCSSPVSVPAVSPPSHRQPLLAPILHHGSQGVYITGQLIISSHSAPILMHAGIRRRLTRTQLRDPSLFKQDVCYVNGEWVKARSGKTFEVHGKPLPRVPNGCSLAHARSRPSHGPAHRYLPRIRRPRHREGRRGRRGRLRRVPPQDGARALKVAPAMVRAHG